MSELSIHELETEHAEVLPEREALSFLHIGGGNHVTSVQVAFASASRGDDPMATATNSALILVG